MPAIQRLLFLAMFLLASACAEGPNSHQQLATQGLISGALSSDGSAAVVGSLHHGGSFWDLGKGERLFNWNHQAGEFSLIRAAAISSDGNRAVTCVEDAMVVWDTQSGESLQYWRAPSRILTIEMNRQGSRALMGLNNGTASYFDLNTGATLFSFEHDAEVRKVAMNADASLGITGGDDKTAKIWSLESGKLLHSKTLENFIHSLALSPSGNLAFVTSLREDALIWDTASGDIRSQFPNRYTNYTAAVFSEDEQTLTVGTFQGEVKRWGILENRMLNTWQAKPRKSYGGSSSKAILDLADTGSNIVALTSDGLSQTFIP